MIEDACMDTKYDDFAKRDGATKRRPDEATDTAAYRDAMDPSQKSLWIYWLLKVILRVLRNLEAILLT